MISVCIATYNGADYIQEQIRSILSQIGPKDQVVVSDDRSTDNTVAAIRSIEDKRVELYVHEHNVGYTANFERALSYAKGGTIFLSDQDDIWLPNKVTTCMKYLQRYDLVVSDAKLCDAQGKLLADSFYAIRKPYTSPIGNVIKFGYLGCCLALNRNVLDKAMPFPSNREMATHDNWLFLVGQFFFKVGIIKEPLILYRRHGDNVSTGGMDKTTTLRFKIVYRLYLTQQLIARKWSK